MCLNLIDDNLERCDVLGFVTAYVVGDAEEPEGKVLYVEAIATSQSYQEARGKDPEVKGVGSMLLDHVMEIAEGMKGLTVTAKIRKNNENSLKMFRGCAKRARRRFDKVDDEEETDDDHGPLLSFRMPMERRGQRR